MTFTWPLLLGPVFFGTTLPCSGGYHLERGWMRYMMRLGLTVKRVQLLNLKAQVLSLWAKWCMVDDCVCVLCDLT